MPTSDEYKILKTDISRIDKSIERLEAMIINLSAIKSRNSMETARSEAAPAETKHEELRTYAAPQVIKQSAANKVPAISPPKSETSGMSSTGSAIGAVGIAFFILGAALIVRMAISAGWLTPIRQWALVAILGVVLNIVGFINKERDNEYLSYLIGAGVVILYFAAYSGAVIFNVINNESSIVFVSIISIYSVWLLNYFSNPFFALTAAAGTYLAPLILGYTDSYFLTACGYFAIWTVGYSVISALVASRQLSLIVTYFSIGIFALINLEQTGQQNLLSIIIVQCLQFISIVIGVLYYSVKYDSPMESTEVWSFFPALLFFYGTQYYFLHALSPTLAPWISLAFVAFLFVIQNYARNAFELSSSLESEAVTWAFASIVFLHSVYLNLLPEQFKPYLLIVLIAAALLLRGDGEFDSRFKITALVFFIICIAEYGKICLALMSKNDPHIIFPAVGSALMMLIAYFVSVRDSRSDHVSSYLYVMHLLAMLSLYNITTNTGTLAVSISWALYAGLILGYSYSKEDWILTKSSVVILVIASIKALIYDAANATTEIRIVCMLLTGLLLYGAGYLFRKIGNYS